MVLEWRKISLFIAVFLGGGVSGFFLSHLLAPAKEPISPFVRNDLGFSYVKPLLYCNAPQKEFVEYGSLQKKVEQVARSVKEKDPKAELSVYMRDLQTGAWMGVNENERFTPASLLKVPMMLAYYKYAETHPDILEKKVLYDGTFDQNIGQNFKSAKLLTVGTYSVDELIRYMIVHSDNNALELLRRNLKADYLLEVFTDLGLPLPPRSDNVDFMSPKSYSFFFRTLYNATYLNHAFSEKAMKLLAEGGFAEGIRSGIPSDINVAEKFGERAVVTRPLGGLVVAELHDCGIVYRPESPYLLCVMTRGGSFAPLAEAIRSISKIVYEYDLR
ncbi:MAG: serine hydrolase [Patescibacteria group bacterium]